MNYQRQVSEYTFGISPSTLPLSVDLRPKCSPVADQGSMNSCVAFALIGAMEYLENLRSETFVSLSPQFVYYNERLLEETTELDSGTYMPDGIEIIRTYGACELSLWPYNEENLHTKPDDKAYADAATRRVITTRSIEQTQNSLMCVLAEGYPIAFGILAYESLESLTVAVTGFVPIPNISTETLLGGHAMLLVGYDLAKQQFLVRNSWGSTWGVGGYCWMPFAYVLNPNLANSFYTIESIDWPKAA